MTKQLQALFAVSATEYHEGARSRGVDFRDAGATPALALCIAALRARD